MPRGGTGVPPLDMERNGTPTETTKWLVRNRQVGNVCNMHASQRDLAKKSQCDPA